MLTKEQLLQKRVVCTGYDGNHYPGSLHLPGEILYEHKFENGNSWYDRNPTEDKIFDGVVGGDKIEKHPHLFRKLLWWERRIGFDLPIFVKLVKDSVFNRHPVGEVCKVAGFLDKGLHIKFSNDDEAYMGFSFFIPSDKEEYDKYQQDCREDTQ